MRHPIQQRFCIFVCHSHFLFFLSIFSISLSEATFSALFCNGLKWLLKYFSFEVFVKYCSHNRPFMSVAHRLFTMWGTVTGQYHVKLITKVRNAIEEKSRKFRKGMLFHQENALAYIILLNFI